MELLVLFALGGIAVAILLLGPWDLNYADSGDTDGDGWSFGDWSDWGD